jgi:hypothetical protein
MIPPILTDEEAEALSRGWRRIRSGWEIPTLLLLPVAPHHPTERRSLRVIFRTVAPCDTCDRGWSIR